MGSGAARHLLLLHQHDEIIAYPRNLDTARRTSLTGPCKVKWQDGFRRIIEERFPGRLAQAVTTTGRQHRSTLDASERTGLTDYGELPFREGIDVLLWSLGTSQATRPSR